MVSVSWMLTFVSDTDGGKFPRIIISVDKLVKEHWLSLPANRSIILNAHKQTWKVTGSDKQATQALLANMSFYFEGRE